MLDILVAHGFTTIRQNGTSHRQFRGVVRMVTLAGKPSDDVAIGTLQSIIRQSGLTRGAFRR